MTTTATLEQPQVRLDAGHEATVFIVIRNNGDIVEGYRFEVVGIPADWAEVEPAEVSLYPGDTTTARVTLRPPRSPAIPAGELHYGVRILPIEHPDEAVVPEGVVEVLPFLETTAELIPRSSHGRRRGMHQVAIDNRGNVPVSALLDAGDAGDLLDFTIKPSALTINPGNAAFADVRVKPRKAVWRKPPSITHPFTVTVTPHAGVPVTLDGTYVQEPLLPKWLFKALLALIALLGLLALLWFVVLRPTIRSAAKDAVAKPLAHASSQAAAAQQAAAGAQQAAAGAQQQAGAAQSDANKALGALGSPTQSVPAPTSAPLSKRLEATTASGGTSSTPFFVPAGTTLSLTDLVLENPQGDFGTVTLSKVSPGGTSSTLLSLALENFRDIDYHFVSPIVAKGGAQIVMSVTCTAPGTVPHASSQPTSCDTAIYLGGTTTK